MTTGTLEVSRSCWQTSKPSSFGSITSRSIISYSFSLAIRRASSPSYAQSTSMPSCSRLKRIPFTISFSSSTTNTFFAFFVHSFCFILLLYCYFIFYFSKHRFFDPADIHNIFDLLKSALFFPVTYDIGSFGCPDAGKRHQFFF